MFSLDLLLEVIREAFYENMRKRILQKVNISANSDCWLVVQILRKNMAELAKSTPVSGDSKRKNISRVAYIVLHKDRSRIRLLTLVP